MNEMNDAYAYEMQCNYGSQTPEVLHAWSIKRRLITKLIAQIETNL
jgi:hypothetical protein